MKRLKTYKLLILIVLLGLFLRLLYFNDLTFGYDQARDALESISIIKNLDVKIIGPTTDIKGLFHSPLYWYIVAPFYYLSGGDPRIVRIPMILINLINIVFIYFFVKKLFNKENFALFCSLIMAVSFESVEYARWLSNPSPALLTVGVFFYGLWLVLEKKKAGLPLMLFFWGLSINFQLFLVYQAVFVIWAIGYLLLKSKKTLIESIKKHYWIYGMSLLTLSFYIAAQIKFRFMGLISLISFIFQPKETAGNLIPKISNFIYSLVDATAVTVTGYYISAAKIVLGLIVLFVLFHQFKKSARKQSAFLFIWLISPIFIYAFQKNDSYFLNIGILYPLIILTAWLVFESVGVIKNHFIKKIIGIIIFVLIIGGNLYLISFHNCSGEFLFSVQYKQNLNDELKIIDYVYRSSQNKLFAFNSLTNPLYVNSTWAYVFNWYGRKKYGYMPVWLGGVLDDFGREIKFTDKNYLKKNDLLFLIIEPPVFHQDYIKAYSKFEDTRSKLLEKKIFGTHIVEKRQLNEVKEFNRDELTKLLQN